MHKYTGPLIRMLTQTPPLLKAFWRLLVHSAIQVGPCWYQLRQMKRTSPELYDKYWQWSTWKIMIPSGVCLSLHFGSWIWSLDLTSLEHSIVLVCAHPLLVIMWSLAAGKSVSRGESLWAAVGFAGAALMVLDMKSNKEITWAGDALALFGAAALVVYMMAGQELRAWLPLFPYSCPVTFVAGLTSLVLTCIFEDVDWADTTPHSVFGMFFANLSHLSFPSPPLTSGIA
jgi:hypothetical protein